MEFSNGFLFIYCWQRRFSLHCLNASTHPTNTHTGTIKTAKMRRPQSSIHSFPHRNIRLLPFFALLLFSTKKNFYETKDQCDQYYKKKKNQTYDNKSHHHLLSFRKEVLHTTKETRHNFSNLTPIHGITTSLFFS